MKQTVKILGLIAIAFSIILTSCQKDEDPNSGTDPLLRAISDQEADVLLKSDKKYEKVIVNPLVKSSDCKYIVAGTIEFRLDGELAATIDFGDGTCDDIATKTVDGETHEFSLKKKAKKGEYEKHVISPIVKSEDCDYIVEGIVELWKGGELVVTIDFGDGTCDEWATKTWDGGSKTFSLNYYK